MLTHVLLAAAVTMAASTGLVAAVRSGAQRRRLLDHPNDRSLHVRPTPRGGGIGIALPVSLAVVSAGLLWPETWIAATCLAGVGLLIAAVGLIDDVRGLPAVGRLIAHASAAGLVIAGIGTWPTLVWPGLLHLDLGWAAVPFTILLIAGFTNAYNFMDGADGIAGSQAVVAGIGWCGAGLAIHDPLLAVAGAVIAAASLGFLFFNWPPASIFMGDVGSSFLGFSLAALAVHAAQRSPAAATAGMLFVWPFVFDAAFTLLRRTGRRENLLAAHRGHLYQRLVLTGVSHRAVTLLYAALAAIGLVVGHFVGRGAAIPSIAGALLVALLAGALWRVVVWRERAPAAAP
jgi:UDP-N-acetylmuramyl pentapeptide phosphotransferase/UDP-N-acetylglucosamine-1-phosphate transferase